MIRPINSREAYRRAKEHVDFCRDDYAGRLIVSTSRTSLAIEKAGVFASGVLFNFELHWLPAGDRRRRLYGVREEAALRILYHHLKGRTPCPKQPRE